MSTPELIDGPRGCTTYEVGAAVDLMNLVFTPQEPMMGSWNPVVTAEANAHRMRILMVNGKVVAHAGYWVYDYITSRGMVKLGGIWGVATHPDHRRHGYGARCVQDAMQAMRAEGCVLGWLGTGINDWYRKLGWENGGESWSFTLDRATVKLLPALEVDFGMDVWPDTAALLALYAVEGPGVRRPHEGIDVLLRRPGLTCCTASWNGELLAYLIGKGMHIYEQAGRPACILGLLREVFLRQDATDKPTSTTNELGRMTVRTVPKREGFAAALINRGFPWKRDYNGMWWVPDPHALFAALQMHDVNVGIQDGRITLRRGNETATLTPGELVKLILGPEKVTAFAQDALPVGHYLWLFDWV